MGRANNGRTEQNKKTGEGRGKAKRQFHWRIKKEPLGHPQGRKDDQREAMTVVGDSSSHKFYMNYQEVLKSQGVFLEVFACRLNF